MSMYKHNIYFIWTKDMCIVCSMYKYTHAMLSFILLIHSIAKFAFLQFFFFFLDDRGTYHIVALGTLYVDQHRRGLAVPAIISIRQYRVGAQH